jgi:O-methyltransferase
VSSLRDAVGRVVEKTGYEVRRRQPLEERFPDFEPSFLAHFEKCAPYTMTSPERMYCLYKAVEHVSAAAIPGDVVECGVWRGGSSMLAASILEELGDRTRHSWLFDTFEGMSPPTSDDIAFSGEAAEGRWEQDQAEDHNEWCYAPLEDVQQNLRSTGRDENLLHFVKGKVEDTIPQHSPDQIALLRLDTDWYESTYHELIHLFPRIAPGGVLIIDDYGHWAGARKAVDQYLDERDIKLLLNRVDYTARIAVVPG